MKAKVLPSGNEWNMQVTTWREIIERYTEYLQVPRWRAKTLKADGTEIADCFTANKAARLRTRLLDLVEPMIQAGKVPLHPVPADSRYKGTFAVRWVFGATIRQMP